MIEDIRPGDRMWLERYREDGALWDLRLQEHHIPIVTHDSTRWSYITALVVGERDGRDFGGIMPTDAELAMVVSWHEHYMARWYSNTYKRDRDTSQPIWWSGAVARIREKHPFDIDGDANGRYIAKFEPGGWSISHRSWQNEFVGPEREPKTLIEALDKDESIGGEPYAPWETWKAEHPEVFG